MKVKGTHFEQVPVAVAEKLLEPKMALDENQFAPFGVALSPVVSKRPSSAPAPAPNRNRVPRKPAFAIKRARGRKGSE